MDDFIPPIPEEYSYADDPTEEINTVFRRTSIDQNMPLSELAFNPSYARAQTYASRYRTQ